MKILFLFENTESLTAINLIESAKKNGVLFDVVPYFQDGKDQCSIIQKGGRDALVFTHKTYQATDYHGVILWSWGTAPLGRKYLRVFEDQGIPVLNSSYDSEVTDSKIKLTQMLWRNNIPTPKTICCENSSCLDNLVEKIEGHLDSPLYVFKPDYGTRGIGIRFASSITELKSLSDELKNKTDDNSGFIVQEFIGNPDTPINHFRTFVIGDYVVPIAMKVTAKKPMKVSNISAGGSVEFVPASPELINLSLSAAKASGLNVAGVDAMMSVRAGQQHYSILEVNDGPGTKTFDKEGFNVSDMVIDFFIQQIQQQKIA
ncbi:MAG: ATP-grasp domain-containing protein [Cellvibrionaceae bacterium]